MCVAACLCSPRQRVRPTSGDERRIKKNVDEANEEKSEEGFSRRRAPLLIARQGARPDRNQQNPRAARRSYSFFFFYYAHSPPLCARPARRAARPTLGR